MPDAENLQVFGLRRISGGSSRETYSFDLEWQERGETRRRPLIGRRDPTGGLLKSEREREFRVIEAMHRAGLRVPEALFLELDHSVMDRPFFVMHRAAGRTSNGAVPASEPAQLREKIAHQFLDELVRIQSLDYRALGWSFLANPKISQNRRACRPHIGPKSTIATVWASTTRCSMRPSRGWRQIRWWPTG
jgi:aminoglycoside phosphotransferase (APT) family kinase protein